MEKAYIVQTAITFSFAFGSTIIILLIAYLLENRQTYKSLDIKLILSLVVMNAIIIIDWLLTTIEMLTK